MRTRFGVPGVARVYGAQGLGSEGLDSSTIGLRVRSYYPKP